MILLSPRLLLAARPFIFPVIFILFAGACHSQTFSYTGAVQTYTFTNNACIELKAWGAGGGIGGSDVAGPGGAGGGGAYAELLVYVNHGDVLQIYTGGGGAAGTGGTGVGGGPGGWGYGGGGNGGNAGQQGSSGGGGGGGGSSTVLLNGNVILVAAGGGGGGGSGCGTVGAAGGGAGQAGLVAAQLTGSTGANDPSSGPNGAAGFETANHDGGGGGGGGGGWNGGAGGGVTNQGGTDCNFGGGANGGGGGASLGTTIINGTSQTPGNSTDPNLCASCAAGSTAANVAGGNGTIILIISNITLTTMAGNNGPLCPGATLELTSSAPVVTYAWSGPQGFTSPSQNPVINAVVPADSGVYTLIVTDTLGCVDTITTLAVVYSNPVASINQPDTLTCQATAVTLTAVSNITGSTYNWGGGVITNTDNVAQPGTYTVTITSPGTCTASASAMVSQDVTPPVAGIGLPDTLTCAVTTVILTATSDYSPSTFTWSNGVTGSSDNVTSPGPYSVTVTASINGCTSSASVNVVQIPPFTDTFSVSPVTCFDSANGGIQLTVNGVAPPFIFEWSNAGTTRDIAGVAAGSYSVTISDQNQCKAVIAGILVPQASRISIVLSPGAESCSYSTDAGVSSTVTGGTPAYTYMWSNGQSTNNAANLAPGMYYLTVTDAAGCPMTDSAQIVQTAPLELSAVIDSPVCPTLPLAGSVHVSTAGGTAPYQYDWGIGVADPSAPSLAPGDYSVTVTDANNCTADTTFTLSYIYNFSVLASPGITINLGDTASLGYSISGNSGPYTSLWTPGNSVDCPVCPVTAVSPVHTTLYQIEITNTAGCTVSDTVTIQVIPVYPVFVPNAFTPGGNGSNNYFEVFGKKETWTFFEIQIFDRWGEEVYASNDANFAWDGTYKGKMLPPGVYAYEMRVTFIDGHPEKLFTGGVTLLR